MMSITDNIKDSLKYPFKDTEKMFIIGILFAAINVISVLIFKRILDVFKIIENSDVKLLTMGIPEVANNDLYLILALLIFSFLIYLFVLGYKYNIVSCTIRRNETLSDFNNIFIIGIKFAVVSFLYNLIPIVLFILGGQIYINYSFGQYLIWISIVLTIISNLFLIMAINNMIFHENLKDAFDFRQINLKISELGYVRYVGSIIFAMIIYAILIVFVGVILNILIFLLIQSSIDAGIVLMIIAVLEGLFVAPYFTIFFSRFYGLLFLS